MAFVDGVLSYLCILLDYFFFHAIRFKTERVLSVQLSDDDRIKYNELEQEVRKAYRDVKDSTPRIGKKALQIRRMLEPLQIAMAGGRAPVVSKEAITAGDSDDEDDEEQVEKKKKKSTKVFSKYAYTSKFRTLIEELKQVREKDSTSKSLVFSQFGSTLKWLEEELPKHGFQFRTLTSDMSMRKRAQALQDFQKDPPTTIFLLSMRAGAVGINLTQANNVFMMEPCFNPAAEAQAVGRVHRLGYVSLLNRGENFGLLSLVLTCFLFVFFLQADTQCADYPPGGAKQCRESHSRSPWKQARQGRWH